MPPIRCVEPALANAIDLSVVDVPAGQELLFPHVDTCLAMAMLLADGRTIGGHASMQAADPNAPLDPYGNAKLMLASMNMLRGATVVTKFVLIGAGHWLDDFVRGKDIIAKMRARVVCVNSLYVNTNSFGHGADVLMDSANSQVVITHADTQALALTKLYAHIVGMVDEEP